MASISIELTDSQAMALARFLKRATWDTYQGFANPNDAQEGDEMRAAAHALSQALADQGFDPR